MFCSPVLTELDELPGCSSGEQAVTEKIKVIKKIYFSIGDLLIVLGIVL